MVSNIQETIQEKMGINMAMGRKTSNLILSNITWYALKKSLEMEGTIIPELLKGEVGVYLGMKVVVLDSEDDTLLVG